VDLLCGWRHFNNPKILSNGTEIAWPAGRGQKQAEEWRRKKGVARPSEPGAGP
jgi:hypothetical protein